MATETELLFKQEDDLLNSSPFSNDRLFDTLFKEEDLSWQTLLYQLVDTHQMDPWDVDVALLSKKFLEMVKKLKELDFRISGKVVLAAAILLKMKSTRFVSEDITNFDSILHSTDNGEIGLLDDGDMTFMDYSPILQTKLENWVPNLLPRTPQQRKRKVSIFDLVNALEKALEVKNRRVFRIDSPTESRPLVHHRDISLVIKDVYEQVLNYLNMHDKLIFTNLVPQNASKDDKVLTFIPLLHLRNQQKVDLLQEIHFGEIEIQLMKENIDKPIIYEEPKPQEASKLISKKSKKAKIVK